MAAIVGKRLPTQDKHDLGRGLRDTMHGDFEDDDGTEGDVLASVYRERLGPLSSCLERDGEFMVIRLTPLKGKGNRNGRAALAPEVLEVLD